MQYLKQKCPDSYCLYLADTLNDFILKPRVRTPIAVIYNNKIQMFPTNIIANAFNFKEAEFFKINEDEKANVKVKF